MSEQTQNEIEYIEPMQEHVGQMVEVRDSEEQAWVVRKLITILDDQYEFHFVCEDGKFRHLTCSWKYARIPRPKPQPTPAPVSSISEETQPKDTHDTPKSIDWTKPVRTKDVRAVRVLCTDGPGDYPVVGFIGQNVITSNWTIEGKYNRTGFPAHLKFDLENAPQRIQREYWVNVYDGAISGSHKTKESADLWAANSRIACVKITIDCEEGEGL